MSMTNRTSISAKSTLQGVTGINRRGVGTVYRAIVSVGDLAGFMRRSIIRYAPKYQRGFKKSLGDVDKQRFEQLLPIDHPDLQLDPKRAAVMAVKFLQGRLYTSHVTWNARQERGSPQPEFNREKGSLVLEHTLTIPDTGHRHLAYFLLALWKTDPTTIPEEVSVDGSPVSEDEIRHLLEKFDPDAELVYVEIFNLKPEGEGYLYDEFNADLKPPSTAVALDLNPEKTPSRRFLGALMKRSKIFARDEIETRRNTIGSKSRKLTTNATIEGAVRPITAELVRLEKNRSIYDNLISFFAAFFEEFASHYEAWRPNATSEQRHKLRKESFALSNIMMHPLMRLAFDLWKDYHERGVDWSRDDTWKDAIARLAGPVKTKDPETGEPYSGSVLDRRNPDWKTRVVIKTYDNDGEVQWTLSSTRQTRESAYQYLREKTGLGPAPKEQRRKRALAIA
jgi:hypothetical protein